MPTYGEECARPSRRKGSRGCFAEMEYLFGTGYGQYLETREENT